MSRGDDEPTERRLLQIVDGNRLLRGYINVLERSQKFHSKPQQRPRAAPSLARWIRIDGLVGCRTFKVMSQNKGVLGTMFGNMPDLRSSEI